MRVVWVALALVPLSFAGAIFHPGAPSGTCGGSVSGTQYITGSGDTGLKLGIGVNCGVAPGGISVAGTGSGIFGATGTGFGYEGLNANLTNLDVQFFVNGISIFSGPATNTGISLLAPGLAGSPLNSWELRFTGSGIGVLTLCSAWFGDTSFHCGAGSSAANPLPPNVGGGGIWGFNSVNSGLWFDPPLVDTYDYAGVGGTLFSSLTLPTGYGNAIEVLPDAGLVTSLGIFAGGSTVNFGSPVSAFRVAGISPMVDAANPNAFPLQIFFATPTGSFSQTAVVPEPSTAVLAALGFACLVRRRIRSLTLALSMALMMQNAGGPGTSIESYLQNTTVPA